MCEIPQENLDIIVKLFQSLGDDRKLVVVSSTNPLQYNYILNQINPLFEKNNISSLESNNNVYMIKSFDEHNLSIMDLAKIAIESDALDKKENHIISIHRNIYPSKLGLENASFSSEDQNKFFNEIDSQILGDLHKYCDANECNV
jgi:hypothetical protein